MRTETFIVAGGNHLDVDALAGERRKHRAGDAGVAAHAGADHADLGDIGIGQQFQVADRLLVLAQQILSARQVGAADGEGKVGAAVVGDVLHDHVDVDAGLGRAARRSRRRCRADPAPGARSDLQLPRGNRRCPRRLPFPRFHHLIAHKSSRQVLEAGQHLHPHPFLHRQFDAAGLQHLGADGSEFQHFLVGDFFEFARLWNDPRVGDA